MKMFLPTGISNYKKLRMEDYYTVDKTLMIQEFLERGSAVTLITRPRRFGKTMNMSMMAEFFDITKDSKALFDGLAIMDTEYIKDMNQYPVVFMTFADCTGDSLEELCIHFFSILRIEFAKYLDLLDHENVSTDLKERYLELYQYTKERSNFMMMSESLATICELLHFVYDKPVMLFLDEYDTPFIDAHIGGFYKSIKSTLSSMLSKALKTNTDVQYAMITGIQRVAKANVFSKLNNLKVCTVADEAYAQYFGFTKEETMELLSTYHVSYTEEVKELYDGYLIGEVNIYNPWSIINYAQEKRLKAYWVNTSENKMIRSSLKNADKTFRKEYETLIEQGALDTIVNLETSFYELEHDDEKTSSLWGLLVNAGYLTIEKILDELSNQYRIRIPNQEILSEFKKLTANYLDVDFKDLNKLFQGLLQRNQNMFLDAYQNIISMYSYYDLSNENAYHLLLILCLSLYTKNHFELISNREKGNGRTDVELVSIQKEVPSYVIELKYVSESNYSQKQDALEKACIEAYEQVIDQRYVLSDTNTVLIILAHSGKHVKMKWIENDL